jgi:hypothetical protein
MSGALLPQDIRCSRQTTKVVRGENIEKAEISSIA